MLRNAFDGLATESTLKRLISLLNFARDPQDRMRVIVDGGSLAATQAVRANITYGDSNSGNGYVLWYATVGSPASTDPRDELRSTTKSLNQQTRNQKWTYT